MQEVIGEREVGGELEETHDGITSDMKIKQKSNIGQMITTS